MLKAIYALLSGVFTLKTFMGGLMMTILAIVLYNLFVETTQEMLNFTLAKINGVNSSGISNPSVSGFAGWAVAQLKLPEALSVIASAVSIRFLMRKIPFINW